MDSLINKSVRDYKYTSRYSSFYIYYNELDLKYMYGLTNHIKDNFTYTVHIVQDGDSFDQLALKYYGRPDLFWVICDANKILDSYATLFGNYTTLIIPDLASIRFNK